MRRLLPAAIIAVVSRSRCRDRGPGDGRSRPRVRAAGRRLGCVRTGHARRANGHAPGPRHRSRPRHCALGRRSTRARHVRLGARGRAVERFARRRHRRRRHALRHARLGERRQDPECAPDARLRLRRLRLGGGDPVPVRPLVDRVERAKPAALAQPGLPHGVRDAAAQPGLRGDPRCVTRCARCRRRHRAARGNGRRLACALHPRHGAGRSTARRVRPQSLRARSSRDAVERRLRPLRNDHDGDDRAPRERDPEGIRPRTAVADGAGLPVEPAGSPARRPARRRRPPTSRPPPIWPGRHRGSTC